MATPLCGAGNTALRCRQHRSANNFLPHCEDFLPHCGPLTTALRCRHRRSAVPSPPRTAAPSPPHCGGRGPHCDTRVRHARTALRGPSAAAWVAPTAWVAPPPLGRGTCVIRPAPPSAGCSRGDSALVRWCAVTERRGYPPGLRNGSPRRQAPDREYASRCPVVPPPDDQDESRFPGKAAG